jgi:hypothetical protein
VMSSSDIGALGLAPMASTYLVLELMSERSFRRVGNVSNQLRYPKGMTNLAHN